MRNPWTWESKDVLCASLNDTYLGLGLFLCTALPETPKVQTMGLYDQVKTLEHSDSNMQAGQIPEAGTSLAQVFDGGPCMVDDSFRS